MKDFQKVKIKFLSKDAHYPKYATENSAGCDLTSIDEVTLAPGERTLIRTGIAISLPEGYEAQVRPRSGLAVKQGITVLNAPGTIDADYRGEVGVPIINLGYKDYTIKVGERIAQMVIAPVTQVIFEEVEDLDETERGASGFGHTGK